MELSDKKARQRVIEEIVDRWKKKYPEKVQIFAEAVKDMRQGHVPENQAMSYKATIPGDLYRQLDYALIATDDIRLFDPDGELQWFEQNYPEFIIPYDRTESVA